MRIFLLFCWVVVGSLAASLVNFRLSCLRKTTTVLKAWTKRRPGGPRFSVGPDSTPVDNEKLHPKQTDTNHKMLGDLQETSRQDQKIKEFINSESNNKNLRENNNYYQKNNPTFFVFFGLPKERTAGLLLVGYE